MPDFSRRGVPVYRADRTLSEKLARIGVSGMLRAIEAANFYSTRV
jgi:hypothetical protein